MDILKWEHEGSIINTPARAWALYSLIAMTAAFLIGFTAAALEDLSRPLIIEMSNDIYVISHTIYLAVTTTSI